jgi:hypothetical protein
LSARSRASVLTRTASPQRPDVVGELVGRSRDQHIEHQRHQRTLAYAEQAKTNGFDTLIIENSWSVSPAA